MSRVDEKKARHLTTGVLHQAFGHLFRRCHLRSQQAFARVYEDWDLSPLQYGILELVMLNPGISQGEIAEGMVTAPSVVTTAMKPLHAAGYLSEEPSAEDARRSGYRLTKDGKAFWENMNGGILIADELLVGPLTWAERDTLKALLQRLAESERL